MTPFYLSISILFFSQILFSQTMTALQLNGIFGKPFQIAKREITKHFQYNQIASCDKQNILKNINGFYGMIGPDVNEDKVKSVYELFAGDGMIQGVFFDNGNITFVKKFIRTEKLVFEEKHGKIPSNLFITALFTIGSSLKLLPNIIGRANTALININKNTYALFEGDNPYLLNIDFENKAIDTIKKVNIPNLDYFCAHSKFNNYEQQIESVDYDVMNKAVNYYLLNSAFQIINQTKIATTYMPFVHDFVVTNNSILVTESPFSLKMDSLRNVKVPIELDKNSTTKIHIIDKSTNKCESYEINQSIFIFHYALLKEDDYQIIIFAPIYESMDFNDLNVEGKYRKVIINKETKRVTIEKNEELEKLSLDFPLRFDNKIVLLNGVKNKANGFVICDDLNIIYKHILNDRYICGEPAIVYIKNTPHLIAFENDPSSKNSYLLIMNLNTYKTTEIPLGLELGIGFHSLFIENRKKLF
jgi:hypothetical protein